MVLTFGGKPFKIEKNNVGTRLRAFLDALSPKQILTTSELADALGVSHRTIRSDYASDSVLSPYRQTIPFDRTRKIVWGNPKAIQELRKQLNEA